MTEFKEHKDTEQLAYNLGEFRKGDTVYITLKMHGTSQRTGYLRQLEKLNWFEKHILKYKEKSKYEHITSTRRVVLENFTKPGFYGSDMFRKRWHDMFIGKLHKGETVYYEVLGYTANGQLIMPEVQNKKTQDPEFVKQYGLTTKFTYGCEPNNSEIAIYRMTFTDTNGLVIEYPTELVKKRAEEMGLNFVPVFDKFIYTTKAALMKRVNKFVDGPDPVGKTHIREGVVVRIDNRDTFKAFKHKSFNFKVLEGIAKVEAINPDMEELQDVR